ncbi:MAG: DUF4190 domain-containing protein [Anaerolineales bacterium]|nr:DUF4190 domain-containing protein [Anaerolineales bacterium]
MENQTTPPTTLPSPPNNTLAIVSLVAGITGFILLPVIGGIAAAITGHMAKKEIKESATPQGGEGMATAGLILGYANLVLCVLPFCVIALLTLFAPSINSTFEEIINELSFLAFSLPV